MSGEPGVVVIGGYANGVSAIRALTQHGVQVAVVCAKPHDIAHRSRHIAGYARVTDLESRPESLIELLEARAGDWRGWVLIPTNDYALEALSRHRERLAQWYPPTVPCWEVAQRVLDKRVTYRLAREAGVEVPRCYGPATSVTAEQPGLQFPVIVKPVEGFRFWDLFGKKLFVATNRGELADAIARVGTAGLDAEVFDLVPGGDGQFYNYTAYIDRDGEPAADCTFRKLRKAPPYFGVCRAAETADVPELREPTLALLRRMEWRGMASAEYKLDPRDGRYRLMEINGRCFLTHGLPTRCGINYPLLTWREHAMGQRVSATHNGWQGVWVHVHADLLYTLLQDRGPEWSWREFIASYRRPKTCAVWSLRDPGPALAQWVGTVRKALRGTWSRRTRNEIWGRFHSLPAEQDPGA